jgi:type II secretory pathway component HofQ
MNKFSKPACITILVCLLAICISSKTSSVNSKISEKKVLIEAIIVEISGDALNKLQISRNVAPSSKITVPFATLLYVLADPNAVKTIASAKIVVYAGQMGQITDGQKLKYLVKKDDGSFEEMTTDMSVGTTLEATPIIKDGDILLNFKFEHYTVAPPQETDPQTSLPIGPPTIKGRSSVNTRLKLAPGEPMIAGGIEKPTGRGFILVRAEILKQPFGEQ